MGQWDVDEMIDTVSSETVALEHGTVNSVALEHETVKLGAVVSETAGSAETGGVGVQQDSQQKTRGVLRGAGGRLLPGTPSLNPAGRKSRQYEKDMITAIRDALPPDKVSHWINRALQLASEQNSARGIIATLDFATAYAAGKPVQQVTIDAGRTELLEQLLHGDNGEPLLPDVAGTDSTSVL